jgi:2-dehydropantoate 2-reductase
LHEGQRLAADFDVAFVAMKAYDTAWATHMALPRLGPAGYVVSAQNCWNDPGVAAIAGQERSVGLVMSKIAVALWEPGHVSAARRRAAAPATTSSARASTMADHPAREALAKMLSVVDGAKVTDNLWGERWCKLCANAMGNPVQAMTQLGSLEIAAQPRGREITIRLAAESARVGLAAGYSIPKFNGAEAKTWASADDKAVYAELDAMLVPKATSGRNWKASMAQDVAKGRRSEIEQMNGHVAARGLELGVPTPVTSAVIAIVREIDAGTRKPSPTLIEQALTTAGS